MFSANKFPKKMSAQNIGYKPNLSMKAILQEKT